MTLMDFMKAIRSRILLVIVIPLITAGIMAFVGYQLMPDIYTAETTLYVLNKSSEDTLSYSDVQLSSLLVNDYRELVMSRRVLGKAAEKAGLTQKQMKALDIQVVSETDTRVIKISVSGEDPNVAANVANAVREEFSSSVIEIMQVENVNVVDPALVPTTPSGPARNRNIFIAFVAGLLLAVGLSVLLELMNTTIRSSEEAEAYLGIPVLARIPKFN